MDLTIRQFTALLFQIGILLKLELGETSQPRMSSASMQHKMAIKMFGGKKK